jgi:hypothetical protein
MGKRSKLLSLIAILGVAIVFVSTFGSPFSSNKINGEEKGESFHRITRIRVVSGDRYEITYVKGGDLVCANCFLKVKTVMDSKSKIINLFNAVQKPKVCVLGKSDTEYMVDIIFVQNSKEFKFSDWLKSNRLTYG